MSDRQNLQVIATALEHLSSDLVLMDGLIPANDQVNPENIEHVKELAVRIEDTADRVHNIPRFLGRTPCNGQELLTHGFRHWPFGFQELPEAEARQPHDDPKVDFELMDLDDNDKRDIAMLGSAFDQVRVCARQLLEAVSIGVDDVPKVKVPNDMWTTTRTGRIILRPRVVIEEARERVLAVKTRCQRLADAYRPANQMNTIVARVPLDQVTPRAPMQRS
ncbi:MAG: hypothetical protein O9327_03240 [Polaromonas sp.]|nr:hypothetical protein [Polaromonas sp.]